MKRSKGFGNRNGLYGKPKPQKIIEKEDNALYKLTREEQETHITWGSADRTATVYTADPVVIRKLDKLRAEFPDVYECTRFDSICGTRDYTVPARYVRFAKPASQAKIEAARKNGKSSSF